MVACTVRSQVYQSCVFVIDRFHLNETLVFTNTSSMSTDIMSKTKQTIAVAISGYENGAMRSSHLQTFLRGISNVYHVDVYVHGWSTSHPREKYYADVDVDTLKTYFTIPGINLRYVHVATTPPSVCTEDMISTSMPRACWKHMWGAKHTCLQKILDYSDAYYVEYSHVVFTRFDWFVYEVNQQNVQVDNFLPQFIQVMSDTPNLISFYNVHYKTFSSEKAKFTHADKFVVGPISKMTEYVRLFHLYLDDVYDDSWKYGYDHKNVEVMALLEGYLINSNRGTWKKYQPILIVGSGIAGAVIARTLVDFGFKRVYVIDGNCELDTTTMGILDTTETFLQFVGRFDQWVSRDGHLVPQHGFPYLIDNMLQHPCIYRNERPKNHQIIFYTSPPQDNDVRARVVNTSPNTEETIKSALENANDLLRRYFD